MAENCAKGDLSSKVSLWNSLKKHLEMSRDQNEKRADNISLRKEDYLNLLTKEQAETTELLNQYYYSNAYLIEKIVKTMNDLEENNPSLKASAPEVKKEL